MAKIVIADWNTLEPLTPGYILVADVDLVIIRWPDDDKVSLLYGRCKHRGALMADGHIRGENLVCGLHGMDYRYKTGVSAFDNDKTLHRFNAWVEKGKVWVDDDEISLWEKAHPQPYNRDAYQGLYQGNQGSEEEPHVQVIQQLAQHGKPDKAYKGPEAAMASPRQVLSDWDDIQLLKAQLQRFPLDDKVDVNSRVLIGPAAVKPLQLDRPLLITGMNVDALSIEARQALAQGAELAGTGICSGEADTLQQVNSRYFYEYASGRSDFFMAAVKRCQAFHFKASQVADSSANAPTLNSIDDYRDFANEVRDATGGIPIGVKISAQHIEDDIAAALKIGVDYIILDGRGAGASSLLFGEHAPVPTIPALARARQYLDYREANVSLIITGGLCTPSDFVKALALGADAIALGDTALKAIGCLGVRACHSNKCPVGIATQDKHFRRRLVIDKSAEQLNNFFRTSTHLMKGMARACGYPDLNLFSGQDLTTFNTETALLAGIIYGGLASV